MKYVAMVIGTLLGIAAGNARAEQGSRPVGATAKALSYVTIGSIKMAALNDKMGEPSVRRCIAQLDDHALAGPFEKSLGENMSEGELRYLDTFYATALADKYNLYTVQEALKSHGGELVTAPVTLSSDDVAKYRVYAQSEAGRKLTSLARLADDGAMAAVKPLLVGLIRGCRGGS